MVIGPQRQQNRAGKVGQGDRKGFFRERDDRLKEAGGEKNGGARNGGGRKAQLPKATKPRGELEEKERTVYRQSKTL